MNGLFLHKNDNAINEIIETPYKYIENEDRMNKLLSNWNDDLEFKNKLISLINTRKEEHAKEQLAKALENYEEARQKLEQAMNLNGFERHKAIG